MTEALRAEQLSVRRGARTILSDVSLTAEYGSLLAIAGPNGAGKSTLLKALLGLTPSTGRVHVAGAELADLRPAQRARTIAYIPQHSAVMAGVAVLDVVAQARYAHRTRDSGPAERDPAVQSALARTDCEALVRRSFDTLSGGEQRRVLLARALATGANILLFDEPTAGLDIAYVLRFFRLAERLRAEGRALVCVLHDLGDVQRYADRALLLEAGRSAGFGPTAEVLSAEQIARVYGVSVSERTGLGFSLAGDEP